MDKYTRQIVQVYDTLVVAHITLLDEIMDTATSDDARRCATKASEQICSTVYYMIHDTGVEYIHNPRTALITEATLRAMERAVFPSPVGGYTGFGLYPTN